MANEPDVPSQLYRALSERLQNSDKEGAIEVYYELLTAGRSIGEILNGADPGGRKSEYGAAATAEQPRSGPHRAGSDRVATDFASAGVAQANAACTGLLTVRQETTARGTDQPDGIQSTTPYQLGPDGPPRANRERHLGENLPESDPDIVGLAGAHTSEGWKIVIDADNRERFWSGNFLGIARSVAFWALYTGTVASASIAGYSMLHRDHAMEPTTAPVQPNTSSGNGALAAAFAAGGTRGAATDRGEAEARGGEPEKQAANADPSAVQQSRPGEPHSAVPTPLQPIPVGVRGTASASKEAAAPAQSDAGQSDAIEQLIEQMTGPAEAPPGAAREITALTAPSPSVVPAGAADAVPHSGAGQPAGEKPDAAPGDEAKATASASTEAPTENVSAALSPEAPAAKTGRASTPRGHAGSRHSSSRRASAKRPQLSHAAPGPGPYRTDQAAGSYYADSARVYDGAYGPSPNADTGN